MPHIESRLRAEATISWVDTDNKLIELRRELDKMRMKQSITDYKLSELRKEAAASKAPATEMEPRDQQLAFRSARYSSCCGAGVARIRGASRRRWPRCGFAIRRRAMHERFRFPSCR